MSISIEASILRVLNPDGEIVGTGFLVAAGLAITCAHVVKDAGQTVDSMAGESIKVQFIGQKKFIDAIVIPEYWRDIDEGDVAFLRLDDSNLHIKPLPLGFAEHSHYGNNFRSFGFATVAEVQGILVNGSIDGYLWEHSLIQLQSPQANSGVSGAPIFDINRNVVIGMLTKGHNGSGRNQYTTFATPFEFLSQTCPEIFPSEVCPYLGLESFTAESTQFFFGREALTRKLLDILRGGSRLLALFGPSGSGKSSVVRAGVLPALKNGLLPGSKTWIQITIRPADNPFEQLKAKGFNLNDPNVFLESHANAERIVLFIDQYEELFTLCPGALRDSFVQDIESALKNPRLMVILSMRDEFYSAFNAKSALLAQSEDLKIGNVPASLKVDELVAMIENPAKTVGLLLEEGFIERILNDLAQNSEAPSSTLPLLEFTLTELWKRRSSGTLTHRAYQNIYGVTGSLARWADDAYSDLPDADQGLAESLITSLVHLGDESQGLPHTRRRRLLSEFEGFPQYIIKHFADRRLIVTGDDVVELIHDALLREWQRIQDWIKNDRDNIRLWETVIDAAKEWKIHQKDENFLVHYGGRLNDIIKIIEQNKLIFNASEKDYINACLDLKDKQYKEKEEIEIERRSHQLANNLRELAGSTAKNVGVDEVFQTILNVLDQHLPIDTAAIWLVEDDKLHLAACHNGDKDLMEKMLYASPEAYNAYESILSSEGPIIRKFSDPQWITGLSYADTLNYSAIAIPLYAGDSHIGIITLAHGSTGKYSKEAQVMTSVFAGYAVDAIENARSFDLAQEQAYASAALLQVAQAVVSLSDLDEILGAIVRITPILIGVRRIIIYRWDSDREIFFGSYKYGFSEEEHFIFAEKEYSLGVFPLLDFVLQKNILFTRELSLETNLLDWLQIKPDVQDESENMVVDRLLIAAPLSIQRDMYGVMLVEEDENARRFRRRRLEIINGIAQQVALAIQNDMLQQEMVVRERLETEVQLARQIQQTFIPESLPSFTNWQFAARWRTARQVGGDFYDLIKLPDNKLGVFIADVADKGMPAALFMALTRTLIRSAVLEKRSPANAMQMVNNSLLPDSAQGMFVTAVYGELDTTTGIFTYVNAGHNPPILVRQNGEIEILRRTTIALGVVENQDIDQKTISFGVGDNMLLYTDGLTEASSPNGDLFGEARLINIMKSLRDSAAEELLQSIEESSNDFIAPLPLSDDITMLAIRRI